MPESKTELNGDPIRIFCTCRDPGAAWQIRAFIEEIFERGLPGQFCLAANAPAFEIVRHLPAPADLIPLIREGEEERLISEMAQRIRRFSPDVMLVGLSYPGFQIDEAALEAASETGLATVAIQDYWGSTGSFRADRLPDLFFVMDELAASWTAERTAGRARTLVTGSPRHFRMRRTAAVEVGNHQKPDASIVTFFGQPREIPGVLENIEAFFTGCTEVPATVKIQFRLHPKEESDGEFYCQLAARAGIELEIVPPGEPLEKTLLSSAVVVTCFSSAATEHHYLQLFSDRPLGAVIFLNIGPTIREFIRSQTPNGELPSVKLGLAALVEDQTEIGSALNRTLRTFTSSDYVDNVRRAFGRQTDPVAAIWRELGQIVHTPKFL